MDKLVVCTVCPMSCEVKLTIDEKTNDIVKVENNRCPRGKNYAEKEFYAPERTLTTTVKVDGGVHPLVPVRTDKPIPKERMLEVMEETARVRVTAPLKMGDIIVEDILGTGANLVASRDI